jgi:3-oxoacyl-[acyl-carrier-protein] synthase II
MPSAVVVTGCGLESPLGSSMPAFAAALSAGQLCGARLLTGFVDRAAVPSRRARRLSRLAHMTIAAARSALADAGLSPPPDRTAIVLGTAYGSLGLTVQVLRAAPDADTGIPALFPASILNEPAAQVAIELGLRGPNLTVTQHEASVHGALALAKSQLELGRADVALVGGCDERTDELDHALGRLALLTHGQLARPYDRRRDGFATGEAAVVLVLERACDAAARGARPRARLAGVATADRLASAGGAALAEAGLAPTEIGYLALAGRGSVALDAAEARGLAELLGRRPVPGGAIAGATGECGATAGLRLLQALVALDQGLLAGTPGHIEPDPAASVPGLLRESCAGRPRAVLVPALAIDGTAAAAVLLND